MSLPDHLLFCFVFPLETKEEGGLKTPPPQQQQHQHQ